MKRIHLQSSEFKSKQTKLDSFFPKKDEEKLLNNKSSKNEHIHLEYEKKEDIDSNEAIMPKRTKVGRKNKNFSASSFKNPPPHWEKVWDLIVEMRKEVEAPVDQRTTRTSPAGATGMRPPGAARNGAGLLGVRAGTRWQLQLQRWKRVLRPRFRI